MADHGHKRDTNARRFPKAHLVAGPIAFLATASVVGVGVLATSPDPRDTLLASEYSAPFDVAERGEVISRSNSRADVDAVNLQRAFDANTTRVATLRAVRNADTRLWATVDLNLWTSPEKDARKVGLLESGEKVLVTGRRTPERVEIVWKGESRWVTAGYLSEDEPIGGGDVNASCTNGTTVPSGVSPNIVAVHRAVCSNFPEITVYGTLRGGGGDHPLGRAVDIMVSGDRGWQVAEFVRANYAELGVSYVIYSQKIWSVERSGEGWRGMEDRGSTTANHYDHVHVSTY